MTWPVRIEVSGVPVPWAAAAHNHKQGGRFIPNRQARQAARFIAAWEATGAARIARPGGVLLGCVFEVVRPSSHFWRDGVRAGPLVLRPDAPSAPTGRPDLSNLLKLVEDSLTTHAWEDDDQIVRLMELRKSYGPADRSFVMIMPSQAVFVPTDQLLPPMGAVG
jgi:Holliday junction resolvase RusA-like endonuclease